MLDRRARRSCGDGRRPGGRARRTPDAQSASEEIASMDATTLLTRDHQEVERLFKQFEKLTGRAQKSKQKIVTNIIRELAIHAAVEEMLFYPAVRTAALKAQARTLREAADTVLESLEEHHVV